jgi:hypothetical protein
MTEDTNLIDYAYPMMMAERAMHNAHDAMLNREHDKAIEQMLLAITEARMALNSIKHMKEQHDALRK